MLLIVAAVILAGAWTYVGLPSGAEGKLIDAAEAAICLWLALPVIRARRFGVLAALGLYIAWVLSGVIYTSAPSAGISSDLRLWLLLPVLATLLACRGPSESRARVLMTTLLALGILEFLVTIVQAVVVPGPLRDYTDSIVGTFGVTAQSIMGVTLLLIACLGAAGYLTSARHGRTALVIALVLPLFSAWAVVKMVTVALPVVVLLTAVVACVAGKSTVRRAVSAFVAAVISSCLVLASYAVWDSHQLRAFASFSNFNRYASTGSVGYGAQYSAGANGAVMATWGNSNITAGPVPGLSGDAITVTSVSSGWFGAYLEGKTNAVTDAQPNRTYHFAAEVVNGTGSRLFVTAAIQWRNRKDQTLSSSASGYQPLGPGKRALSTALHLNVVHTSPPGTAYAVPYLIAAGNRSGTGYLAPGSVIYVPSIRLTAGASAPRSRSTKHTQPGAQSAAQISGTSSSGHARVIQTFLPGHFKLLHKSLDAISGNVGSELFGRGAGSTSTAALAAAAQGPQDLLPNDASAGHYSDAGTLIVERGFVGMLLALLGGAALVFISMRTARDLPGESWSTAFTLAIPGTLAAVAIYGLISTGLQAHASALIFWLILGVGLAPWLGRSQSFRAK